MKINGFGVTGICMVVAFVTLALGDVGSLYCEKPYIM